MDETDKKVEKIEKEIAHKIETKWDLWTPPISIEDVLWLIDQLKKCREENKILCEKNDKFSKYYALLGKHRRRRG